MLGLTLLSTATIHRQCDRYGRPQGHNTTSKSRLQNRSCVLKLRSRVFESTNGRSSGESRGPLLITPRVIYSAKLRLFHATDQSQSSLYTCMVLHLRKDVSVKMQEMIFLFWCKGTVPSCLKWHFLPTRFMLWKSLVCPN